MIAALALAAIGVTALLIVAVCAEQRADMGRFETLIRESAGFGLVKGGGA